MWNVYDVIIIGGGSSGLAAVVSASTNGISTIVLEKEVTLGGTTLFAMGSVTAGCTELQRKKGIEDSEELFLEDLKSSAKSHNLSKRNSLEFLQNH